MLSKIFSAAILGLEAQIVEVETEASPGLRHFSIVGLPDKAVEESKERIGAAIKSAGFQSPHHRPIRVLVSLAPADLKKEGSLYDLPIAVGFLLACKQIKFDSGSRILIGELGLDGSLRPVKGVLPIALAAKQKAFEEIILPKANAREASLVRDLKVIGLNSLKEVIDYLLGKRKISPFWTNIENLFEKPNYPVDLAWIKGQSFAKRALEIAAAGGHHLLMQGPPGTGKTLLAKAIPSILPSFCLEESLEVTKIYSIAGLLPQHKPLVNLRPFRSPHHTASEVALIGGGNPPRPGEITLAHRGVLFLDEWPEFHRDVLESLRQPIEEGQIVISRSKYRFAFPAKFTLVAATNPCPCGYYGQLEKQCICQPSQIAKYRRKLSGPIMDRIDLFIHVPKIEYQELAASDSNNEGSDSCRERIERAAQIQKERFKQEKILANSEMNIPQLKKYCPIDSQAQNLLSKYIDSGRLSVRGYHRVLKSARTIADLAGSENILFDHLSEALSYRLQKENK